MIDARHLGEVFNRFIAYPWLVKLMSRAHVAIYKLTRGGLGSSVAGIPVLLLSTRGRKTGKVRTSPLFYLPNGEDWVVVASAGGSDKHPAWWLNLLESPRAQVQIRGRRFTATAFEADPEMREKMFEDFVEIYPSYRDYQKATDREIPLVVLRPI